jgi:hypothetical protein
MEKMKPVVSRRPRMRRNAFECISQTFHVWASLDILLIHACVIIAWIDMEFKTKFHTNPF